MPIPSTETVKVEFTVHELKALDRILQFHDCAGDDDELRAVEAIESKLAEVLN